MTLQHQTWVNDTMRPSWISTEQPLTTVAVDDPGERTDELPLDLWLVTFP